MTNTERNAVALCCGLLEGILERNTGLYAVNLKIGIKVLKDLIKEESTSDSLIVIKGERYKLVESEKTVICKQQCAICEKVCKSMSDRICERLGGGKRSYFEKV